MPGKLDVIFEGLRVPLSAMFLIDPDDYRPNRDELVFHPVDSLISCSSSASKVYEMTSAQASGGTS